ncbi:MAG TPA: recombinase family protein [Caldisericia bacterium]|nr:recombinase family protein [Caldisericia bacterium]HPQ93904.1 recombinase family protein [Caldisericia bacterium]HRV75706.1 recombinase family protein [Caldisericia bacterium]
MKQQETKQKAIGYIRVSSDEQAREGLSLESQRQRIESYCQFKGFDLIAVYSDDGVSGYKPIDKRPQGKQAVQALREGQAQHFIAIRLDRCFRNTKDAINRAAEFQAFDIDLHLFDIGVDTSTANGKLFFTIMAGLAQFERDVAGERTKNSLDRLRETGRVYNHTPYGYDANDGLLIENKQEQKAIKLMIMFRQSGSSYQEIADELTLRNFKPKLANKWSKVAVLKILRRETATV